MPKQIAVTSWMSIFFFIRLTVLVVQTECCQMIWYPNINLWDLPLSSFSWHSGYKLAIEPYRMCSEWLFFNVCCCCCVVLFFQYTFMWSVMWYCPAYASNICFNLYFYQWSNMFFPGYKKFGILNPTCVIAKYVCLQNINVWDKSIALVSLSWTKIK